ncbi:MAG: outer membrane protein transport protein [Breznakibacter sp.]
MRKTITVLFALAISAGALAEGYQINLQGTRQTGMGHTGTGLNFGASSIHFNPGALALMKKRFDMSIGGSAIYSSNVFQKQIPSVYSASTDNPVGTPFYFYAAGQITGNLYGGLGVTTPYGSTINWDDEWDGRYLIQDISLKVFYFQPTLAYAFNEKLSVGAGFVYATGDVTLRKALPISDAEGDGQAELSGSTSQYGYNVGAFFQATEKFSIGLNYRSEISMEMNDGKATFSVPSSVGAMFPNTTFKAALPMPANLVLGVGYQISDKLLLAADLQYVFWDAYKNLNFDFAEETQSLQDSKNIRDFANTLIYRVGAEYKLSDKLMVRAGGAFDSTPIPEDYLSPETPGSDKINLSVGLSYAINNRLSLDASFLYIKAMERKDGYKPSDFYGTYNTNALIPGFGINYTF